MTVFIGSWLWAIFTVAASVAQTFRNAMQRELTATLGTVGATHVRFLFGLPFALMFLFVVLRVTGQPFPHVSSRAFAWTLVAGLTQIGATALMLAAMRERSFVVTIAYTKTEPVQIALFGLIFLGDRLSPGLIAAILIATAGVMIMSWPKRPAAGSEGIEAYSWRPALIGIAAGALFGLAAVCFRGGIRELSHPNFVVAATTTLAIGLTIQTVLLTTYLLILDRAILKAIFRAWRPSIVAGFMGAFASQLWFLAFAIESAARVRTLALIEILFAQMLSRNLFKQSLNSREGFGVALIIVGVVLLLNL